MKPTFESSEHHKIHDAKAALTDNARRVFNGDFPWNFRECPDVRRVVKKDIQNAWDDPRQFVVERVHEHVSGTVARLLTDSPTREERRKIREMAGMSDISKIKNHKRREAAKAQEDIKKGGQVANKYGITPDDLRGRAPSWDSHDEENFQDNLARANEEEQY